MLLGIGGGADGTDGARGVGRGGQAASGTVSFVTRAD
jgi:hypothetical protein